MSTTIQLLLQRGVLFLCISCLPMAPASVAAGTFVSFQGSYNRLFVLLLLELLVPPVSCLLSQSQRMLSFGGRFRSNGTVSGFGVEWQNSSEHRCCLTPSYSRGSGKRISENWLTYLEIAILFSTDETFRLVTTHLSHRYCSHSMDVQQVLELTCLEVGIWSLRLYLCQKKYQTEKRGTDTSQ